MRSIINLKLIAKIMCRKNTLSPFQNYFTDCKLLIKKLEYKTSFLNRSIFIIRLRIKVLYTTLPNVRKVKL